MTRGDDLRQAIMAEYEVQGAAAEALVDTIVRTADELEQLEAAIDEHGPLIQGARGQYVANPALAAAAKHRELLARLMERAFPGEHESTSQKASRAARQRWARNRGAAS